MDFESKTETIINNNNNNNSIIDSNINSYSMPSTTTTNESFANIGGLTQTTATLTPTTLKNIEESFMEIIPPRAHPQEARFVPPLVNISANYASLQVSNQISIQNDFNNNSSNNSNSNTSDLEYGSDYETDDSSSQSQWNAYIDRNNSSANSSNQLSDSNKDNGFNRTSKQTKIRGRSGRKPLRNDKLTPEEEKKRQQRRERNKQAAARCRKRRMDHTNSLLIETDGLEDRRHSLLSEIEALRKQKEELEFVLEAHKTNCKLNSTKAQQIDVKPVLTNGNIISMNNSQKLRPNSLSLPCIYGEPMSDTGIPIQTPSTGLFLEAMSESGTGLTPTLNTPSIITPSTTSGTCSARLKSSPLSESPTSRKLVTL